DHCFCFQAEAGIRDFHVTGVQTCALPISGVRSDFGFSAGQTVMPFYDSLIGKLVVWAADRDQALARAARVLGETDIVGIKTTVRSEERRVGKEWRARWSI